MELHGLGGVDLAHLAGPADAAAAVVVRHVGGGQKLLDEPADGVRVGAHAPLFNHHIALLVELARHHVRQPAALQPRPKLQPVLRHRPEIHGLVEPGLSVQALAPLRSATSVNWLGMTYLCASVWASTKACFSSASFCGVAAHGLQVLGLVGVVGRFHLGQRNLFGGVIFGADLAGSLEGQVLEHMRQAALARGVVHVARVNKGGIAEDRRLRPLADDQRQPVGQHLGGDPLLKALQVLSYARSSKAIAASISANRPFQNQGKLLSCIRPPSSRRAKPQFAHPFKVLPSTGEGQTGGLCTRAIA